MNTNAEYRHSQRPPDPALQTGDAEAATSDMSENRSGCRTRPVDSAATRSISRPRHETPTSAAGDRSPDRYASLGTHVTPGITSACAASTGQVIRHLLCDIARFGAPL